MPVELEVRLNLFADVAERMGERVGRLVDEAATAFVGAAAARILDGPKTGHVYLSDTKPSPHQASAPGEAPANWTGELVDSIQIRPVDATTVDVAVTAEYAARLEYGEGAIAARPFLTPAADEVRAQFTEQIAEFLRSGLG